MQQTLTKGVAGWAMLGMLVCGPCPAVAQNDGDEEYRVKLAFLCNFTKFIEWPAEVYSAATAPLVICVLGQDPFQGEIQQGLRGRTASGHPIEIKKLRPADNPKACQIVFVRSSEKRAAVKMITAVKGSSTLTIGESADFAAEGGVINFTLDDNRLGFEINLGAASQTGVQISSKLLMLAKIVKER